MRGPQPSARLRAGGGGLVTLPPLAAWKKGGRERERELQIVLLSPRWYIPAKLKFVLARWPQEADLKATPNQPATESAAMGRARCCSFLLIRCTSPGFVTFVAFSAAVCQSGLCFHTVADQYGCLALYTSRSGCSSNDYIKQCKNKTYANAVTKCTTPLAVWDCLGLYGWFSNRVYSTALNAEICIVPAAMPSVFSDSDRASFVSTTFEAAARWPSATICDLSLQARSMSCEGWAVARPLCLGLEATEE